MIVLMLGNSIHEMLDLHMAELYDGYV